MMELPLMRKLEIKNDESPTSRYRKVLDVIPTGIENAISMEALSRILNVSQRETRSIILQCRIAGNVVCSCDEGYYIPDSLWELKDHYCRARARINTATLALKPIERVLVEEGCAQVYYESLFPDEP